MQPDLRMHCGIILSNRGVLLGLNTVRQLLALADAVQASPLLDSVWVVWLRGLPMGLRIDG